MNIENVDYSTKIPNNVNLAEDRQVLRALESWHPGYIDWGKDMGPGGFQGARVYLSTAVSVDPKGWAKFDYVKMPEYRWGILLAPRDEERKIPFGRHYGEPAWQDIPGEYRASGGSSRAPPPRCRQAAHARRLQRRDAGLAVIPHVHLLHRSRRQDAARKPGAIRLRSAVAHLPLHADGGSPPHVRRRDRRRPHHPAYLRGDASGRHQTRGRHRQSARARRDRPADDAEKAQPALHAVARSVRLGSFDQRRQHLHGGTQGPLPGNQDRRRQPAQKASS